MSKSLATLSAAGWVKTTAQKLDFKLAWFFEAEEPQSYLYRGEIADIHAIIARNSHDPNSAVQDLEISLKEYLLKDFDHVEVEGINISEEEDDPRARVKIKLIIRVHNDGQVFEVNKFVYFKYNKFKEIINAQNYGI